MTRPPTVAEVVATCEETGRLFRAALRSVPRHCAEAVRFAPRWEAVSRRGAGPLLIILEITMADDAEWLSHVRSLRDRSRAFLAVARNVPCQGIAERVAKLNVRDPGRIHVATASTQEQEKKLFERLLLTLGSGQEHERILDAWWEDDTFVAMNPRFKRLHVPLGEIGALAGRPPEDLGDFEIDDDGVFIYWPRLDVHLGWEQFAQLISEADYLRARQQSAEFNKRYGGAIRALRQARGLRQSDVKGLTPRQVGRIERGECRATRSAIAKFASAHGLSSGEYFSAFETRFERTRR